MNKHRSHVALAFLISLAFSHQSLAAEPSVSKPNASQPSVSQRRQAALSDARDGRFEAALPILQALTTEAPNDIGIKVDYIVVLTWAKKIKKH